MYYVTIIVQRLTNNTFKYLRSSQRNSSRRGKARSAFKVFSSSLHNLSAAAQALGLHKHNHKDQHYERFCTDSSNIIINDLVCVFFHTTDVGSDWWHRHIHPTWRPLHRSPTSFALLSLNHQKKKKNHKFNQIHSKKKKKVLY